MLRCSTGENSKSTFIIRAFSIREGSFEIHSTLSSITYCNCLRQNLTKPPNVMVGRIVILMEESNDFGIPYCNIGKSQSTPFGLAMSILPNFRPKIVIMMGKTKVWVIIYEFIYEFNIAQMGCKHCGQRDEQLAQLQLEEPGLVL